MSLSLLVYNLQFYRPATMIWRKISIYDQKNLYFRKWISMTKDSVRKNHWHFTKKSVFCQILRLKNLYILIKSVWVAGLLVTERDVYPFFGAQYSGGCVNDDTERDVAWLAQLFLLVTHYSLQSIHQDVSVHALQLALFFPNWERTCGLDCSS